MLIIIMLYCTIVIAIHLREIPKTHFKNLLNVLKVCLECFGKIELHLADSAMACLVCAPGECRLGNSFLWMFCFISCLDTSQSWDCYLNMFNFRLVFVQKTLKNLSNFFNRCKVVKLKIDWFGPYTEFCGNYLK